MKNSKLKLAMLLLVVLVASCKKTNRKPYIAMGKVTFEVTESDSVNKNVAKFIRYGYDNHIIDTLVFGSFKTVLEIPASSGSSDVKNVYISCETSEPTKFRIAFSQRVESMNNKLMFNCSYSGTCSKDFRELSQKEIIYSN
jgi:hypothetical protein